MNFEEAIIKLESFEDGVPFDHIDYLYHCNREEDLIPEICFHLKNVFNEDLNYSPILKKYRNSPLWFCVVAENYPSLEILDSIIHYFVNEIEKWDFIDEQAGFLIGLYCDKLGDPAVSKVFAVIEEQINSDSKEAYLYLFDAIYFCDIQKYEKRILNLLDIEDQHWLELFCHVIAGMGLKSALPQIKKLIEYFHLKKEDDRRSQHTLVELNECYKELSSGKRPYPEQSKPYCKTRSNWRHYYGVLENKFYDKLSVTAGEIPKQIKKAKKIGRNDKCPCGSGKKYKKCCWV